MLMLGFGCTDGKCFSLHWVLLRIHYIQMGGEESKVQERVHSQEYLENVIRQHLTPEKRLQLSHQANVWQLCNHLCLHYPNFLISQIHLDHNMVAGEVIQQLTKINFQKAPEPLRVLTFSHNDIKCDNLKYFRGAHFNCLRMLYLDHNLIASDGCYYLSKTSLKQLQTLDLSFNRISQNAAGHLSNTVLPCLINLKISNNPLSYKGLTLLGGAEWPSLAFLQAVNLDFEPTKEMQQLSFRTQIKMFRLQLQ